MKSILSLFLLLGATAFGSPIQNADDTAQVSLLTRTGATYAEHGQSDSAMSYYLQALKLSEAIEYNNGIAAASLSIGDLQVGTDKSLYSYLKSVDIYSKIGDKKKLALAYKKVGDYYFNLDNKKSFEYYFKALEINKGINNKEGEAFRYGDLSQVYEAEGKHIEALRSAINGLRIAEQIKNIDLENYIFLIQFIAGVYEGIEKYDSSLWYNEKGFQLAKKIDNKKAIANSYYGFSVVYSKLGNYKKAFDYQSLFYALADSIRRSENIVKITDMQNKYEADKRESQIALKNKENELKQQAEIGKQKLIKNFSFAGVALLLVLALVIFDKYRHKHKSNIRLEDKNRVIAEKNKEITDNINYAKRIQDAVLTPASQIRELLPNSFLFYQPKDIVSGDFYWAERFNGKKLFAVGDCTGHGVSGALMSTVGMNLLNQAISQNITKPSDILDYLNDGIKKTLHQTNGIQTVKDGMDIALCLLDEEEKRLYYAGAYNPLWIVRKSKVNGSSVIELEADKLPIGQSDEPYSTKSVKLEEGDCIYLFTDGYADQFGGEKGKKFKYKPFAELLKNVSTLDVNQQQECIGFEFKKWKKSYEQTDDVLIMGIKV